MCVKAERYELKKSTKFRNFLCFQKHFIVDGVFPHKESFYAPFSVSRDTLPSGYVMENFKGNVESKEPIIFALFNISLLHFDAARSYIQ